MPVVLTADPVAATPTLGPLTATRVLNAGLRPAPRALLLPLTTGGELLVRAEREPHDGGSEFVLCETDVAGAVRRLHLGHTWADVLAFVGPEHAERADWRPAPRP